MKLSLAILLICALVDFSAGSPFIESFVDNVAGWVSGTLRKFTSEEIHNKCIKHADSVREHPFNAPYIEKVSFQLRTPCNLKEVPVAEAGKLTDEPEFDASKATIVFVAGWFIDANKEYIDDVAKAFHCRGNNNFLVANTGGFLKNEYINAAYHTGKLGEFIAIGLQNLGIPSENIHLIGHSLGAQIVGSAGRHYYELTGKKIQRITGLDPARPCFESPVVFPRLTRDDAVFVDVIHTNPTELGIEEAVGHADFYPGGLAAKQNGCAGTYVFCAHERAIYYFAESVYPGNENSFMSSNCSTEMELKEQKCSGERAPMGYATDKNLRGIHHLTVRSKAPYGKDATNLSDLTLSECGRCPA